MKRLLFKVLLGSMVLAFVPAAQAKHHDYDYDRWHSHHDSRAIYVIENHRPVRRLVYIDDRGAYYRIISGRRVYVRERYFTSYPSRYYYSDGRPRVGVSIHF